MSRVAVAIALISCATSLAGCQRPPDLTDLKEHFAAMESHIDAQYQKLKSDCEGMPDSKACREAARQWYMDQFTELNDAYLKALDEHWAERRRRAR